MKLTFEVGKSTLSSEVVEQFKVAVKSDDHKTLIRLFMQPGMINDTFEEEKEGNNGSKSVRTPLDWAAEHGSTEMLHWLIKLGALTVVPNKTIDPLRSAMRGHKPDNVTLLLSQGAECRSGDSEILRASADVKSFQLVFDAIVSRNEMHLHPLEDNAKFRIYFDDDIDKLSIIVSHIADDSVLNSLLKYAVESDFPEACELLLQKVKKLNDDNLLMLAVTNRKKKVVSVLCGSGRININEQSKQRITLRAKNPDVETTLSPLFVAIYLKEYDMAISILQSAPDEVNVNEVNEFLGTPFLFALDKVSPKRTELLHALMSIKSLDVTMCGSDRRSPLHDAMYLREVEVVSFILSRIDETVTLSPEFITALSNTKQSDYSNVLAVLQEFLRHPKSEVNTAFEDSRTLLNYAVLTENLDLVVQLLCRPDIVVNHNIECMEKVFRSNTSILKAFLLHADIKISYFNTLNEKEAFTNTDVQQIIAAKNSLDHAVCMLDLGGNKFSHDLIQSFNACPNVVYNYLIRILRDLKSGNKSSEEIEQFKNILVVLMNLQVSSRVYNELCVTLAQSLSALPPEVNFKHQKEITAIFFLNAKQYDDKALLNILADIENIPADQRIGDRCNSAQSMLNTVAKVYLYKIQCLTIRPYMDELMVEVCYEDNPDPILLLWNISRWYAYDNNIKKSVDPNDEQAELREVMGLFQRFMGKQKAKEASVNSPVVSDVKELARRLSATFADVNSLNTSLDSVKEATL